VSKFLVSAKKALFIALVSFNLGSSISAKFRPEKSKWEEFKDGVIREAPSLIMSIAYVYILIKMTEEPAFKVYKPGEVKENFTTVAGNHEAKESFKDIVEYLKNPEQYKSIGAKPTTGILLTGAPGTGKTLLARALAGEANCSFIYASGAEFNGKFVGSGVARIKKLFYQARNQRTWGGSKVPCIIFIDEIEVLARHRGTGDNYGDQSVNELLTQLDGFVKSQDCPVIVIAATNYPSKVDVAVLRPGRIDRIVHISSPDLQDRKDILQVHLNKVKHDSAGIDLSSLAQRTIGFTGADLAEVINTAARLASNRRAEMVFQQDLEEALDMRTIGVASKRPLSEKEKYVIAYHEAGHALIGMLLTPENIVNKITILPRGQTLGVTHFLPTEEPSRISTKEEFLNHIAVLLGGRAAEEIIFKIVSTGPSNDLQRATQLAQIMVRDYGMGNGLTVETNKDSLSLKAVQEEVERILQMQYNLAKKLLQDNIDCLRSISNALVNKETLIASDIRALYPTKKKA
jgi:cell division protease FtsH